MGFGCSLGCGFGFVVVFFWDKFGMIFESSFFYGIEILVLSWGVWFIIIV